MLLVHRPRYGDWSFPKGKLDRGELAPVAAVREVGEETGVRIRLGTPLSYQRYPSGDRMKTVSYWHGRVIGDHSVDGYLVNDEIDEVAWVPLRKAKRSCRTPSTRPPSTRPWRPSGAPGRSSWSATPRPAPGSPGARTTGSAR